MNGRDEVGACAIRVMLADDHRATLCGLAMVLDAPFAADWLRRVGRRPDGALQRGVGTVAAASTAGSPSVRDRADVSVASVASTADNAWMDPSRASERAVAEVGSIAPSAAVWFPVTQPCPTRHRTARRRGDDLVGDRGDAGDSDREHDGPDFDDVPVTDDRPSRSFMPSDPSHGTPRRTVVRDGIVAFDGDAGTAQGASRSARTARTGRLSGAAPGRDERAAASVVVTGAYARSADLFDALSTTPCDVLVCDLAMGDGPHGDGLTMIGYLRRQYPCIKVIVHTMCLHACVLRNLQLLHVHGILSKRDDLAFVPRAVAAVQAGTIFHGPAIAAALAQAGYQDADRDRPAIWSRREAEVIRRFVNGEPVKDIARALSRSVKTISTQKMSAMHKAGISSNAELYQYAAANGLLLMPGAPGGDAWQWYESATQAHAGSESVADMAAQRDARRFAEDGMGVDGNGMTVSAHGGVGADAGHGSLALHQGHR